MKIIRCVQQFWHIAILTYWSLASGLSPAEMLLKSILSMTLPEQLITLKHEKPNQKELVDKNLNV